jgi:hypothetical protein
VHFQDGHGATLVMVEKPAKGICIRTAR